MTESMIEAVRLAVLQKMGGNDASHDMSHLDRVERLGVRIAIAEGVTDTLLVRLSCLLHDIEDYKYRDDGDDNAANPVICSILHDSGFTSSELQTRVCEIIKSVSFHGEIQNLESAKKVLDLEAACVQDADRLDGIGAIGIARCFTFGGAKKRVLYDPALKPQTDVDVLRTEYTKAGRNATTINHFYEKLLLLDSMMKTKEGKRLARHRHQFMEKFLEEFHLEWEGER
jgi:uncharacterized protein